MPADLGSARARIYVDIAQAVRNVRQMRGELQQLNRSARGSLSGMAGAIDQNSQHLTAMGQALVGVGLVGVAAFGGMLNSAANFEQGMDGVLAALGGIGGASGITKAQFEALSDEALRIGETTSKSATEASMAMELMAKAGVDLETILNGGAQAAVNVSEATSESLDQSAATMSTLTNLFKDTGISASDMGDVIVNAMNASDASMSEFQTGMARLAPAIKGASMSASEAASVLTYFNAQGFSMAETGTSLAAIFQSVVAPATDEAAAALQNAGIQAFDAQGNFIGFPALFDQIAAATAGMTEEQKANFLSTAFMTDGMDLLQTVTDDTGASLRNAEKDIARTGTAAEASAIRMDNLKGSWEEFMGTVETLSIKMGRFLLPAIRAVVDMATMMVGVISSLPTPILAAVTAVGALTSVLALLGGAMLLLAPRAIETAAAIGAFRKWGGITRVVTGLAAAMRALSLSMLFNPVILAAVAAALAGILVYRTDFLGMASAVRAFRDAWNAIGSTTNNGISRLLSAASAALRSFDVGILDTLADKLSGLSEGVESFFNMFRSGNASGEVEKTIDNTQALIEWVEQADGTTAYMVMDVNAETGELEQVGEIIESYTDENDPNIAHIKIRGDDGEYWTTVDKTTGEIADATITVNAETEDARSGIQRLHDGLQAMQETLRDQGMPFLANLVQAADVGLSGVEALLNGLNGLSPAIQNWIIGFGAALAAVRPMMAIGGMVVRALSPLMMVLRGVGIALAVLTSPIGLIVVAIAALAAAAVYAYKNFEPFRNLVDDTAAALRDFATGPALDFLEDVANGLSDAYDAVREFIDGIESVEDAFSDVARLFDQARAVMGSLFDVLASKADVFGESVSRIGDLITTGLSGWASLISGLGNLISGDFSAAWSDFGDAAQAIIENVGNAFLLLGQLAIDAFQAIPWGDIASGAVDLFLAGLRGAGAATAGIWSWLTDSVSQAFADVRAAVGLGIQLAWDQITSLDWSAFIPSLAWSGFVVAVNLAARVGAFAWDAFVTAVDLTLFVADLAWDGFVTAVDLTLFVAALAWDGFVTAVRLADYVFTLLWTSFVKGVQLFEYVVELAWDLFVKGVDLVEDGIATMLDWADFINPLNWPSPSEILGAIVDAIRGEREPVTIDTSVNTQVPPSQQGQTQPSYDPQDVKGTVEEGVPPKWLPGYYQALSGAVAEFNRQVSAAAAVPAWFDGVEFAGSRLAGIGLPDVLSSIGVQSRKVGEDVLMLAGAIRGSQLIDAQPFLSLRMDVTALGSAVAASLPLVTTTIATNAAQWSLSVATHTGLMRAASDANFLGMRLGGTTNTAMLQASVLGSIASTASGWATRLGGMLTSTTSNFGSIRSTGTSETNSLKSAVGTAMGAMESDTGIKMAGMKAGVALNMLLLRSSATSEANTTESNVSSAFRGLVSAVQGSMQTATTAVSTHSGAWAAIVRAAGGPMHSAGMYAGLMGGAGVVAGLRNTLGDVRAAAAEIINVVVSTMNRVGQMRSPSRRTALVGKNLVLGLFGQIQRMLPALSRLAGQMVDAIGNPLAALEESTSGIAAVRKLAEAPITMGGMVLATDGGRGGGAIINNNVTFGPGSIVQQPGEDGEALARRVIHAIQRDYDEAEG